MASHLDKRNIGVSSISGWGCSLELLLQLLCGCHVRLKLWSDNVNWNSCVYQSVPVISFKWYVKGCLGTVGVWELRMRFSKTLSLRLRTIIHVILTLAPYAFVRKNVKKKNKQKMWKLFMRTCWTNEIDHYLVTTKFVSLFLWGLSRKQN